MEFPLDLTEYKRVLKVAKRPDIDELVDVIKIAGGGIVIVGFLGFCIYFLMSYLPM